MPSYTKLKPWKTKIIQAYWLHNRHLGEISKYFYTTENCLRTLLKKETVRTRNPRWSAEDRRKYQLHICDRFGWPRERARKKRYDAEGTFLDRDESIIREYVDFQEAVDTIALFHTCSPMTVWRILKKYDVPLRPPGRRRKEDDGQLESPL